MKYIHKQTEEADFWHRIYGLIFRQKLRKESLLFLSFLPNNRLISTPHNCNFFSLLGCLVAFLLSSTVVNADAIPVGMDMLNTALKGEIDKIMQISNDYEINLSTQNIKLEKENEADEILIKNLAFDPGTYHFHGFLNTKSGNGTKADIQIRGTLQLILDIPVANRMINSDEEIAESDITWQKIPLSKINQSIAQKKEDLIGKTPKNQPIKPGLVIRKSELKSPIVVKRNDTVTIVYRDEGLILSAIGEAKQDGAKGDLINFILPSSKKNIQARVKSKGQAEFQVIG